MASNKKYIVEYPSLMAEWCFEKNSQLGFYPEKTTHASTKLVWWKCQKCDYSWTQTPASRTSKNRICPACSGKKLISGKNDLATISPDISSSWDYEKNYPLTPKEVKPFTNKKVWWICENKHSYAMKIGHRSEGHGCPYCAGTKTIVGENDFATWCRQSGKDFLLLEWRGDVDGIYPHTVSRNSKQTVLWECRICGNQWAATIASRSTNIMCPKCASRTKTSFPEQAILFYISKLFPDAVNRYSNSSLGITELDIFIPSISVGIEYDGKAWHNSDNAMQKELCKYENCKKANIKLIRVREKALSQENANCDYVVDSPYTTLGANFKEFDDCIKKVLLLLYPSTSIVVDTEKDRMSILELFYSNLLSGSLLEKFPNISSEWHPFLNGRITPAMVPAYSNESFYFLCPKGHEYDAIVSKRTKRNDSCPYCSGRRVLRGHNDLFTTHPDLIKEWDFEKNEKISPYEISKGFEGKVWWKCSEQHSFLTSPNTRTSQGVGCPKCNGGVSKSVASYTLDGEFIDIFKSVSEAARKYNVTGGAISAACKKKTPCLGMQFRYVNGQDTASIEPYKRMPINNKPVIQYTIDGIRIASFESAAEAYRVTGICKISEVCNGKRKTAGGYIWKFDK